MDCFRQCNCINFNDQEVSKIACWGQGDKGGQMGDIVPRGRGARRGTNGGHCDTPPRRGGVFCPHCPRATFFFPVPCHHPVPCPQSPVPSLDENFEGIRMNNANENQIGGYHYKTKKIQPWDFIAANNLGYFEGNIIKYVSRWKEKNGIEDLRKARHYLDKLIELQSIEKMQNSPDDEE